ncbi:Nudix family hydrolase [uncultured Thiodictyon sp.]|uniref:Nudix family hydrolase n=1 Tax=uncultured Thiodictyon sp. TaxID=1846217 RepID=UPI0025DB0D1E|nr:Nudix family hydrolase [uncultured Thiodictyon sp.]
MPRKQIHVMAGVLQDDQGRVLVTRRPDSAHQGGLWEFPGGKLEPGELPEQGLVRELDEELGIQVSASRPLIRVHHDYGDRHILLDVRRVGAYVGTPHGREGQPLDWLAPNAMDPARFPAADRPIIMALRLPQLLLITGADQSDPVVLLAGLRRALESGIRLIQLRAHELDDGAYRALAGRAYPLCAAVGARLLLNRDPAAVADCPRQGLHLTAHRLAVLARRPGSPDELVGASCHTAAELARAADLGLDYALLSPVKATATHPQARALGWPDFAALIDPVPLPVYALGGLTVVDLADAIGHGAQGIAAIRGLWPD